MLQCSRAALAALFFCLAMSPALYFAAGTGPVSLRF